MFSNLYVRGIRIKQIEEDSYYKYLPAIKYIMDMDELQFNSSVTFLVGENGIGKSTLIEAIAVAMGFNPEGGTKNFSFSTNDSQFIIATHSPILMAFPGAEVLELSDEGIKSISYKDTEHYIITKRFLDAPERMLGELFE